MTSLQWPTITAGILPGGAGLCECHTGAAIFFRVPERGTAHAQK